MNSPAEVITKLLNLEEGLLEQIFAWTVADSILVDINDSTVDIFDALGTDIMAGWRIEENYLKTLSTAPVRYLAPHVQLATVSFRDRVCPYWYVSGFAVF